MKQMIQACLRVKKSKNINKNDMYNLEKEKKKKEN